MSNFGMFGRKKKVDLEELISELTGDGNEDEEKPIRRSIKPDVDNQGMDGVKLKVEFEGVDELIKEIKSLRETMETLIEVLRESGKSTSK